MVAGWAREHADLAGEVVGRGEVDGLAERSRGASPGRWARLRSRCACPPPPAATAPHPPAPSSYGRRPPHSPSRRAHRPGCPARGRPQRLRPPPPPSPPARPGATHPSRALPHRPETAPAPRYPPEATGTDGRAPSTSAAELSASGGTKRAGTRRTATAPRLSRSPARRSRAATSTSTDGPELRRRLPLALVHLRRGQSAARERHCEQQQPAAPPRAHPAGRSRVATAVSSTISKLSEPPSSSAASDAIARPLPLFRTSSRTPPLCAPPRHADVTGAMLGRVRQDVPERLGEAAAIEVRRRRSALPFE